MFASKRQSTVIADGLRIVGTVTAEGLVEVNGHVDGEMNCTSLIVARKAQITGTITADRVVVDGRVEGPIRGGDVVLKSQAHVLGDIQCQSLIVEKGAFMEGHLKRAHANGRQPDGLLSDLTKARDANEALLAKAEISTREAELAAEAMLPSGNPDLPADEAMAFLTKRGNTPPKALLDGDGIVRYAKTPKN